MLYILAPFSHEKYAFSAKKMSFESKKNLRCVFVGNLTVEYFLGKCEIYFCGQQILVNKFVAFVAFVAF